MTFPGTPGVGADRFLTNNHRDFPQTITEIDITYPDQLSEPDGATTTQANDP